MIRSVMFYLNQNKPSVCEAVQTGVKLCRQKGIESVFFESDRRFLSEELGAEFEQAAYLSEPDFAQIDMMFVFGGDGTMLRALVCMLIEIFLCWELILDGSDFCWKHKFMNFPKRWFTVKG